MRNPGRRPVTDRMFLNGRKLPSVTLTGACKPERGYDGIISEPGTPHVRSPQDCVQSGQNGQGRWRRPSGTVSLPAQSYARAQLRSEACHGQDAPEATGSRGVLVQNRPRTHSRTVEMSTGDRVPTCSGLRPCAPLVRGLSYMGCPRAAGSLRVLPRSYSETRFRAGATSETVFQTCAPGHLCMQHEAAWPKSFTALGRRFRKATNDRRLVIRGRPRRPVRGPPYAGPGPGRRRPSHGPL